MRELKSFDTQKRAELFCQVLRGKGIDADLRESREGAWQVWVHDDRDMPAAKELLEHFESDPARDWSEDAKRGEERLKQDARDEAQWQKQNIKVRERMSRVRQPPGIGQWTLALMVICGAVALWSQLGKDNIVTSYFTIAGFKAEDGMIYWDGLQGIRSGQVWRLITPMFLHFGVMHLLFNMLWLKDLGTGIERNQGHWFLLALVVFVSAGSNVAQYYWPPQSPSFGGMSGVVYGLLAYQWVRGKLDPRSGYFIPQTTLVFMLGWLVLCFTGLMGPIANAAHLVGLLLGAISAALWFALKKK